MRAIYRKHATPVFLVIAAVIVNVQQHDWIAGFMAATAALAVGLHLIDLWDARVRRKLGIRQRKD